MKLTIHGDVKAYYVQTLIMLYFPGEHFPEDSSDEALSCEVTLDFDGEAARSTARIEGFGRAERAEGVMTARADYPMTADRVKKLAVGLAVARAASAFTHSASPWGLLTGVRPAKLAAEIAATGADPERVFREVYALSGEKAALCARTARNGAALVSPSDREECSLYVAIPFCPTRCAYCSFVSFTSERLLSLIPTYLDRVIDDIEFTFAEIERLGLNIASVYVGGGTPTTLDERQLERLVSLIAARTRDHRLREFTVEAGRPDTITAEKCAVLRENGVGRISVNTQTLSDEVLRAIGRRHTSEDFFAAYEIARASGIPVINVDLIAGLPGESAESAVDSARRVVELSPENITVHSFSVKKSADLRQAGVYDNVGATASAALEGMHRVILGASYEPYYMYRQKNTVGNLENVGFAKAGTECLYNIYMMDEIHTVFGVGASAVTRLTAPDGEKQRIKRIFEAKYPYEYLRDHDGDALAERRARLRAEYSAFFEAND